MKKVITVVDYGVGNLRSVEQAIKYLDIEVEVANTPEKIQQAESLILPGVGAFANAMSVLSKLNLVDAIKMHVQQDKPFLGICLGMQLMLDTTEEFGEHQGLGIIPGKVIKIPTLTKNGEGQKVPHIGWNALLPAVHNNRATSPAPLFLADCPSVYFVHSYCAQPEDQNDVLATCEYGGHHITAMIRRGNAWGTQFHPEKSAKVGLQVLSEFAQL